MPFSRIFSARDLQVLCFSHNTHLVFFLQGWWKQGWAGPPPHSNAEKARRRPRPPLSSSSSVVPLLVLLSAGFSCLPSLFLGRVRGGGGGNM